MISIGFSEFPPDIDLRVQLWPGCPANLRKDCFVRPEAQEGSTEDKTHEKWMGMKQDRNGLARKKRKKGGFTWNPWVDGSHSHKHLEEWLVMNLNILFWKHVWDAQGGFKDLHTESSSPKSVLPVCMYCRHVYMDERTDWFMLVEIYPYLHVFLSCTLIYRCASTQV